MSGDEPPRPVNATMLHAPETTNGETCGYFDNRRRERLFYHMSPTLEEAPLVVFCNPLLEEQMACQPYVASWLRYLAKRRFNVLTFDYTGTGNSWGQYPLPAESTVEDTADAIEWYRGINPVGKILLIGIRFGANIALEAAQRVGAARIIGVEPILDTKKYWVNLLRANLLSQLSIHGRVTEDRNALLKRLKRGERINIQGYEIDQQFADSIQCFGMDTARQHIKERSLLLLRSGSEMARARGMGFRFAGTVAEPLCGDPKNHYPNRIDLFQETCRFLDGEGP